MLSLSLLAWLTVFIALIALWWQSDKIKLRALSHVHQHCRHLNVQLLDQTMVLRGLWPIRSDSGELAMRRRYEFEFTSTGEMRHKGTLTMLGNTIAALDMEPHPMPESDEPPH